ncbi:polysaccharide biosynthesis/export family protein [Soonwooa sp.]|uniref:polysaccharide biosynthesis/export family protein n=1 Tax=Soonwooa sp. TaxID=1938592 RepID=UPI0028B1CD97|nr:polysaccharide biosynthesis/export family protein [Soonwooa sp.]
MNKKIKLLLLSSFIVFTSCKTKEKASEINYMQNVEKIATEVAMQNAVSTIQKGDQLGIRIVAKDMSVLRAFVPNSQYLDSSTSPYYLVDSNGDIDFPVLGKLNTTGKTLTEFQNELRTSLTKYIINPTVYINITNYKVTILGEVNRPGQYTLPEGQNSTVFNALGLAGDLTIYAKRDDVLLVRTVNGEIVKERINLMDASFFNSPAFQLRQNDVIYVSANQTKEKIARQDPNTGIYMAVAGMVIGLAGIFITIFKN